MNVNRPKGEERDLSQDVSYFSCWSVRSGEINVRAHIKNKPFDCTRVNKIVVVVDRFLPLTLLNTPTLLKGKVERDTR